MGADRFSDEVIHTSNMKYEGFNFLDFGDPAGTGRSQTDEKTCFQILHGKNIEIEPSEQDPKIRIESVRKALSSLSDGMPVLQVDPKCKMIRKGFMGGYQYRRMQTVGERFADKPDKGEYSHPHDALQYVASKIFAPILRNESDADSYEDEEYYHDYNDERSSISGY